MTNKANQIQEKFIPLDPSRLWTFEEARYYLRVGDSTLRNYVREGRVTAYRVGGGEKGRLLLFKKADLDALLIPVAIGESDQEENLD